MPPNQGTTSVPASRDPAPETLCGSCGAGSSPPAQGPELIAVAGSQHDPSSGNKMMFIGQAVRELRLFKNRSPDKARTLIVFTPEYTEVMLKAARDSADFYEAEVVTIATAQELIDYVNSGKDRAKSPVEHLSLFSHGVPLEIAFGYALPQAAQMALTMENSTSLSPAAFTKTARVDSYACRTGMGNPEDHVSESAVQMSPQPEDSLAQLLANHLNVKLKAFITRSDYSHTWGTARERLEAKTCVIGWSSFCREWVPLAEERERYFRGFKFTYQTSGASHPVFGGGTPLVPDQHVGFHDFMPQ